jgi:hypothetical protein
MWRDPHYSSIHVAALFKMDLREVSYKDVNYAEVA